MPILQGRLWRKVKRNFWHISKNNKAWLWQRQWKQWKAMYELVLYMGGLYIKYVMKILNRSSFSRKPLVLIACFVQKQPSRGVLKKRCAEIIPQIYRRTPMPKCDFNKFAKQLFLSHPSGWVLACTFVAYFQNTLKISLDGCFWL